MWTTVDLCTYMYLGNSICLITLNACMQLHTHVRCLSDYEKLMGGNKSPSLTPSSSSSSSSLEEVSTDAIAGVAEEQHLKISVEHSPGDENATKNSGDTTSGSSLGGGASDLRYVCPHTPHAD